MKTISTFLLICFMGISFSTSAQNLKEPSKKETTKQINLLDEQTKMFGQIFDLQVLDKTSHWAMQLIIASL